MRTNDVLPFSAVVPASQTPILYTAQVSDNVEDYYQTFHVTDVEELTDLDDQCSPARRPPHPTPLDTVFDTDQSLSGAELTETLEGMRVRLLATEKQLVTSLSTVQSAHRRIESAVKSLHVDSASLATAIATVAELRQVLKRSSTTTLSVVEFEGYEPGRQAPLSGIGLSDLAPEHVPMLVDQLLARCNLYTRPANHGMVKPSDGPVQSWVAAHAALIELVCDNEWFVHMIGAAVGHELPYDSAIDTIDRPPPPVTRKGEAAEPSSLAMLSAKDGRDIGVAFRVLWSGAQTSAEGMSAWQSTFSLMAAFAARYEWFAPLMEAIGRAMLADDVGWAETPRRSLGCALTYAALALIAAVAHSFAVGGGAGGRVVGDADLPRFWVLVGLFGLCTLAHLLVVAIQSRGEPVVAIAREVLMTLFHVQSAVAVFTEIEHTRPLLGRVAEIVARRAADTFLLLIPASLLLAVTWTGTAPSASAAEIADGLPIASVVVSAISVGFFVASASHDLDASTRSRVLDPLFFGMFGRSASPWGKPYLFATLWAIATLFLLQRFLSISLYAAVDWRLAVGVPCAEAMLPILIKLCKRELQYSLPGMAMNTHSEAFQWVMCVFLRLCAAVANSFLAPLYYRHPTELGALLWTLMFAWGHISSFISAAVYMHYRNGDAARARFATTTPFAIAGGILLASLMCIAALAILLRGPYMRQTFAGSETSVAYLRRTRWDGQPDVLRATIMRYCPIVWAPMGHDVRDWLRMRWECWEVEKPAFFTADWFDSIPVALLPSCASVAKRLSGSVQLASSGKIPRGRSHSLRKSFNI